MVAAGAALALGMAGGALAQGDVVAERRAGLREMGQQMEAIAGIVQGRGDQRQIAARVDQMTPFFQRLPSLVPANSLTPPVAQGTNPGQSRALAAIEANRGGFQQASANMLTQLGTLKASAEAGNVTPDLLRQTGATCGACHQNYRAR
jgi:cytochrome c556